MSLRELTKDKHREAERMNFSKNLVSGNITTNDYALYLNQMVAVYSTMEKISHELGIIPSLRNLDRKVAINEDLVELVGPDHGLEYLPATLEYVRYLEDLQKDSNAKKKILAHMYVRYMGDLNGGQIISSKVPGSGKFYQFKNKEDLIERFSKYLTDDLADEANIAFDYNIKILGNLNHA